MKPSIVFLMLVACATGPTPRATQERTDVVNSPFPQWFQSGAYFGSQPPNSTVSPANPVVVNGSMIVDGGVTVAGGHFAGGGFQDVPFVQPGWYGTSASVGVFLASNPSIAFFEAAGQEPNNDAGYQFFLNNVGILEVNAVTPSNANPQSECQFDFILTDGLPNFSCVGGIGAGSFGGSQYVLSSPGSTTLQQSYASSQRVDWFSCPTGNCGTFAEPFLEVKNNGSNRVQYLSVPHTVDVSNPIIFEVSDGIDAGGYLFESGPVYEYSQLIPQAQHGSDAGTGGVLSVTFPYVFAARPDCNCNVEGANIACQVTTRSTIAASFTVTAGGTDIIDWSCFN